MGIKAETPVEAHARLATLVNVVAAVLSLVARWAGAVVVVIPVGTTGPIGTRAGGTGINVPAVLASEPSLAHTGVFRETINHLALASGSVQTW